MGRRIKRKAKHRVWRFAVSDFLHSFKQYHVTLEGYGILLMTGIVGFAAWHSGTNLLYLLFSMLISFFLMHGFLVWICVRHLEVRRLLPRHVTAMQEVYIPFVVKNRKRFFNSYALRISDHTLDGELFGTGFVVRAPKHGEVESRYRAVFPRRGSFGLRRIDLTTRFPFGLVERGASYVSRQELLVYPQVLNVDKLVAEVTAEFGEEDMPQKGTGSNLYGLREYVPGEHARHIHWRSTAKTGKVVVMEFEREERRRITVALHNTWAAGVAGIEKSAGALEEAVIMTGSLAAKYLNDGYEVELITAGGVIHHGAGSGHLSRILHALAQVETETDLSVGAGSSDSSATVLNIIYGAPAKSQLLARGQLIDIREWSAQSGRFVRSTA